MKYFFLCVVMLIIACKDVGSKHIVTVKKDSVIIKGDIRGDTFYDTISYYDLDSHLIRKSFFRNGKEEGLSTNYDLSGRTMSLTNFSDGLMNGYNSYYDPFGKC